MFDLFFSFRGRIGRRTYFFAWVPTFVMTIFSIVFLFKAAPTKEIPIFSWNYLAWSLLLSLPACWMNWAIQAKRWHDRGKSAWWILIVLVPILGSWWMFIETFLIAGVEGQNRYGPPPPKWGVSSWDDAPSGLQSGYYAGDHPSAGPYDATSYDRWRAEAPPVGVVQRIGSSLAPHAANGRPPREFGRRLQTPRNG